jgi:hypothetical protein
MCLGHYVVQGVAVSKLAAHTFSLPLYHTDGWPAFHVHIPSCSDRLHHCSASCCVWQCHLFSPIVAIGPSICFENRSCCDVMIIVLEYQSHKRYLFIHSESHGRLTSIDEASSPSQRQSASITRNHRLTSPSPRHPQPDQQRPFFDRLL